MKKISTILIIALMFFGCAKKEEKELNVEQFDITNATNIKYIEEIKHNKLDDKYGVINKNFEISKSNDNCSSFNQVGNLEGDNKYFINEVYQNGKAAYKIDVFLKKGKQCNKVTTINDVNEQRNGIKYSKDAIYFDVNESPEGIIKVEGDNVSKIKTGANGSAIVYDVVFETGEIYAIDDLGDPDQIEESKNKILKHFDNNGKLIEEASLKELPYNDLYTTKDGLSLIETDVKDDNDGIKGNYIIDAYPYNKVFKDMNTRTANKLILNNINEEQAEIEKKLDYILFKGENTTICDLEFSKCTTYPDAYLLNKEYALISKIEDDGNDKIYLNKLGTKDIELILNQNNFSASLEYKKLNLKVFSGEDYENIGQLIRYNLK
ncbi:MAG: hypothetical protein RR543_00825 [Erysipelotrichales bacterium]